VLDWIKTKVSLESLETAWSFLSGDSSKAVLLAMGLSILLPLPGWQEGLMLVHCFLLTWMMVGLKITKDSDHFKHAVPLVVFWLVLLVSGCAVFFFNPAMDTRWPVIFSLALLGAGHKVYLNWMKHRISRSGADSAAAVQSFVELMEEPTLQDKMVLIRILCFDAARNETLFQEFRAGMEGKSMRVQNAFLRKFFVKYDPIQVVTIQKY